MEKKLESVLGYIGVDGDMAKIAAVVIVAVVGGLVVLWKKRKSKQG